jgi:RNA polymerase sigma factor FliA
LKSKAVHYHMPYPTEIPPLAPEPGADREKIILQYTPFIKYIAHRLAMRLPPHISVEDLMGVGVIGLMDALNKFDPGRNVGFKTYAEFRIRGAMLDELRSLDWVPRSVRQKATEVEKTILHLEKKKGGPAEDEEIAQEMGLSMEAYHELLAQVKGVCLMEIDTLQQRLPELADEELLGLLHDKKENDPFHLLSVKEVKEVLASAIDELSEREREVLSLYYYEELTLKEIGEVMDLTESRICQIHTKGILKLRGRLRKHFKDGL